MPTINGIAEYWAEIQPVDECNLNFDWADAGICCWNCGDIKLSSNKSTIRLEKCHISPRALNKDKDTDEPSDYVLLCHQCHIEAPDCSNPKYMWEWIKSNKMKYGGFSGCYRMDKALQLYKQRKGEEFFHIVSKSQKTTKECLAIFKSKMNMISTHKHMIVVESVYALLCEVADEIMKYPLQNIIIKNE